MVSLKKLLQKQPGAKIPTPFEFAEMMFGKETADEKGNKQWNAGVFEVLNSQGELLNIHNQAFAAMSRAIGLTPEKFSEMSSDTEGNIKFLQQVRDCEVQKAADERKKNQDMATAAAKQAEDELKTLNK